MWAIRQGKVVARRDIESNEWTALVFNRKLKLGQFLIERTVFGIVILILV